MTGDPHAFTKPAAAADATLLASLMLEVWEHRQRDGHSDTGWGDTLVAAATMIAGDADRAAAALINQTTTLLTLLLAVQEATGQSPRHILQILALAGQVQP